jgi:hypothetical protein
MPRIRKSKPKSNVSEKTRESDEALRRELENADPKKFESANLAAFLRSSKTEKSDR